MIGQPLPTIDACHSHFIQVTRLKPFIQEKTLCDTYTNSSPTCVMMNLFDKPLKLMPCEVIAIVQEVDRPMAIRHNSKNDVNKYVLKHLRRICAFIFQRTINLKIYL